MLVCNPTNAEGESSQASGVFVYTQPWYRLAMDDLDVADDKKRFEVDGTHDEETQPDPDEELMLDRGNGRVWMVKVRATFLVVLALTVAVRRYHAISWLDGLQSTRKTSIWPRYAST